MHLDDDICYRALLSRDHRFDGRFFAAVSTTGVYCRSICPAPKPKKRNVSFYSCAAAAEDAGFRPCMRCRPEASPGTPAWQGTSSTVNRGLRLIGDGFLDEDSVDELAARLGVGSRHLRRLFLEHLGATPIAIALTRRLHFAKRLLDDTQLTITEIAFLSGFSSVRRFNDAFKQSFSRTPSDVRERKRGATRGQRGDIELRLGYRPPFDWQSLLHFLGPRAIAGIEVVEDDSYLRTVAMGKAAGVIRVTHEPARKSLLLCVPETLSGHLGELVTRTRHLFDLGADPQAISDQLKGDPVLRPLLARHRGLRVPGAWDPWETSVRAILGQQVSVKGATTIAGRVVKRYGQRLPASPQPQLTHIFPRPERIAGARLAGVGIPTTRAKAITGLARAITDGTVSFDGAPALDVVIEQLTALRGFGPWTAHYIAMRAFNQPDAFPSGDLVLIRAAQNADESVTNEKQLIERAQSWRPWRAYATMYLWRTYAG